VEEETREGNCPGGVYGIRVLVPSGVRVAAKTGRVEEAVGATLRVDAVGEGAGGLPGAQAASARTQARSQATLTIRNGEPRLGLVTNPDSLRSQPAARTARGLHEGGRSS
jgi:hypothetical protein